jgi:5-methylcytosine-specific restriction enzyme B
MNKADAIREHVLNLHIRPARTAGNKVVSLTAGQIQSEMNLKNRLPAVCSAIGSLRFENECGVKVRPVSVPLNSSTTVFTIDV